MARPALLAAALALLAAACTGSDSTPASESTTAPPTSGVATSSTTAPSTTTTTTEAGDRPEPPILADPFDLAEEALVDVPGYEPATTEDTPPPLTRLELALNVSSIAEAIVWDQVMNEAGDQVFVASVYPYGIGRGDPTLPPFAARLLSQFDEEPEEIPIEHGFVYATAWPDAEWMTWGSNTVIIVAAGPRQAALEVLEALAAANQDEYRWQPGDCLWLGSDDSLDAAPYAPYGRGPVVPCDGWHTHEVIGASILPAGPDAPFPAGTLPTEAHRACEEQFLGFIGIPERESRVGSLWYQPSGLEWEEGDRYLACLVMEYDAAGEATPRRSTLAGIGEASRLVRRAGECRRGSLVGEPVPCDAPHDSEYLGTAYLAASHDQPYSEALASTLASEACRGLLAVAADPPDGMTLDVVGEPPGPFAWSQGDRTVACSGMALDENGVPQLVVGSITEDGWRVIGPVGDAVTV